MSIFPTPEKVDKLASQCVKCALCLPHCPTYQVTEDENESPRGRIALFQAISKEQLPLTSKVQNHLDLCLGCRACEAVCPAHVEYGALLMTGRAYLNKIKAVPLRLSTRFLMWTLESNWLRKLLHRSLWIIEVTGLRKLARKLGLTSLLHLTPLDTLLPPVTSPTVLSGRFPALGEKRGEVMLFTGCTSSWCDQETISASLHVLRKLGYDVSIPSDQSCCGAMAVHAGCPNKALSLATQNEKSFKGNISHIITLATGCSAVLKEINKDFSSDPEQTCSDTFTFPSKIVDIIDFIQSQVWPSTLTLRATPRRVKLHTPCSRRYVLKTINTPKDMLSMIPQLEISHFQTTSCCGAAGTYMVEHAEMATTLVDKLLSELEKSPVDFIATSNIGCALHIQRELNKRNLAIKVGHPVMLLASALDF